MATLILLRHGQSVWNAANIFTGWTDVDLSEVGEAEAAQAGKDLAGTTIDVIHTSDLIRAQRTAKIVMKHNRVSND
nr:histidine phosphatase family protein [Candidatus Poseidoniales archaeon]